MKTAHIRVSLEAYAYLKEEAKRGKTISRVIDNALILLKKDDEQKGLEYERKIAILYPDRKMKSGLNVSKTHSVAELVTIMKRIRKDTKNGDFWTSPHYSSDNDYGFKI